MVGPSVSKFEGTVHALGELVESTGTVHSDRSVLFSVSKDQKVSFRTFLDGKLITEGRVETVGKAEGVLRALVLLKCPGAMSTSAIIAEELTKSLLKKTDVIGGAFYSQRCAVTTVTEGKGETNH